MQDTLLQLQITYSGRSLSLALDRSTPIAQLVATLEREFSVSASTAKLLTKGKKLDWTSSPEATLASVLAPSPSHAPITTTSPDKPIKLLLIGPKSDALESLKEVEQLREKKKQAFQHHQSVAKFAKPSAASRIHTLGGDDVANYKFHELEPFPPAVPMFDKRKAMLERLASDPAVVDIMQRHKYIVGALTELHPILQPTLLGLNTNAGQKISLRLLTDDLEGTRSYNEVRRVLLHELSHNVHGNHDDGFKALNSQLNREVATFESSPYFEPWSPAPTTASSTPENAHRLNEIEAERVFEQFRFSLEDEVELKRERVRAAAEERMRREKQA